MYEIWGFGSFFRAKERPNDVDIVIKYKKSGSKDLLYHLFYDFMQKAREAYRKEGYDDSRFPTPKDALSYCLSASREWKFHPDFDSKYELEFPSDEAMRASVISILDNWIEGITWNMIYKETVPIAAYTRDVLTRRVIQRDLPGIRVSPGGFVEVGERPPIWPDKLHLIWSKENPDVRKNLEKAFEQPNLHDTLLQDLQNISMQLEPLKVQLQKDEHVFRLLSASKIWFSNEKELESWIEDTEKSFKETLNEDQKVLLANTPEDFGDMTDKNKETIRQVLFRNSKYKEMPDDKLGELVESKRQELKAAHAKEEVLRNALYRLQDLKAKEKAGNELSEEQKIWRLTLDESITLWTLEKTNKKIADEKTIRQYLQDLGMKEDTIETIKHPGSTTWYNVKRKRHLRDV